MQGYTGSLLIGLLAALLVSTGCSSFRGDARAARALEPKENSPEGLWVGRWFEESNPNHGGDMTVVLTRTGDTLYRLAARAGWWGVFRSAHDTHVVLTPVNPGEYILQGGDSIWLFGTYAVTGRVDQARMLARYRVGDSWGVMELERPAANP